MCLLVGGNYPNKVTGCLARVGQRSVGFQENITWTRNKYVPCATVHRDFRVHFLSSTSAEKEAILLCYDEQSNVKFQLN